MSFRIDDDKLLEKYKTISSKIGDLKKMLNCQFMIIDIQKIQGEHIYDD